MKLLVLAFALCTSYSCSALSELHVSTQDLTVTIGLPGTFELSLINLTENAVIRLNVNHPDLVLVEPSVINANGSSSPQLWTVKVTALEPGHVELLANSSSETVDVSQAYVRLTLQHSEALYHASVVVGWIYFAAWSVSFYPQIYSNWKRKSVVGLNFDFLSLNILGFVLYSLFNCGLYWIPEVEQEYYDRHPRGQNPVLINDIVFALHASFATLITIIQCFIYEHGEQRVSITARIIHGVFGLFLLISLILAATDVIVWLDFLYYCSYVKLAITLIKYVPQAYMNFKRKSTVGWSVGNVFLDFTGGTLSMLQMIFNAYNYNDWESIFGDPTKFGLGLFSVVFDVFFIIQHYILYRGQGYEIVDGVNNSPNPSQEPGVESSRIQHSGHC